MGKFKPKIPAVSQPEIPNPQDLQAEAEAAAREEAERLRKGRVQTVLTTGQGLETPQGRKTVLGG